MYVCDARVQYIMFMYMYMYYACTCNNPCRMNAISRVNTVPTKATPTSTSSRLRFLLPSQSKATPQATPPSLPCHKAPSPDPQVSLYNIPPQNWLLNLCKKMALSNTCLPYLSMTGKTWFVPVYSVLAHIRIWITSDRSEIWARDLYHSTALVKSGQKFSALERHRTWLGIVPETRLKSMGACCTSVQRRVYCNVLAQCTEATQRERGIVHVCLVLY